MRKYFLLLLFIVLLGVFIWYRTPISASFYFDDAKAAFDSGNYVEATKLFERVLSVTPDNPMARVMYVRALSRLDSGYTVQKKIYEMAESKYDDPAKSLAKSQAIQIKRKLVKDVDGNYIYNAINGKEIMRWDIKKFPLKVYYEKTNDIPSYYKENIVKAFNQWESRTQFLKFEEIYDKNSADIYITFKDYNSSNCDQTKVCSYTVAYTDPVLKNDNLLQRMNLTFYKTNPNKVGFTPLEIYSTSLHEIGHTLGIMGHSDNPSDVMYSSAEKSSDIYSSYRSDAQYLTGADLRTLALLYKMAPTVSNTKDLWDENMYYAPLILGNNDVLLEKKLVELKRYIENYPHFAAGYINISSVYAGLGDYELALSSLETAEKLAISDDERFLVDYNKAILYYNQQDFKTAKIYAIKASNTKNTAQVQELIEELDTLLAK